MARSKLASDRWHESASSPSMCVGDFQKSQCSPSICERKVVEVEVVVVGVGVVVAEVAVDKTQCWYWVLWAAACFRCESLRVGTCDSVQANASCCLRSAATKELIFVLALGGRLYPQATGRIFVSQRANARARTSFPGGRTEVRRSSAGYKSIYDCSRRGWLPLVS